MQYSSKCTNVLSYFLPLLTSLCSLWSPDWRLRGALKMLRRWRGSADEEPERLYAGKTATQAQSLRPKTRLQQRTACESKQETIKKIWDTTAFRNSSKISDYNKKLDLYVLTTLSPAVAHLSLTISPLNGLNQGTEDDWLMIDGSTSNPYGAPQGRVRRARAHWTPLAHFCVSSWRRIA